MDDLVLPRVMFDVGGVSVTETVPMTIALSLVLISLGFLVRLKAVRTSAEAVYELVEHSLSEMLTDKSQAEAIVPLVLTQWLFIGLANLVGLVPGLRSPTADLSTAAALAIVSLLVGQFVALKLGGVASLKRYLKPHPLLLPFNIIGEVSRTVALALRLFGNMLSGQLVVAIAVYLVALLLPIPFLILSVLTGVVQAYIFGVLTLVFTAGGMEAATNRPVEVP